MKTVISFPSVGAFALLFPTSAQAAAQTSPTAPDLQGTWTLDRPASADFGSVLAARGPARTVQKVRAPGPAGSDIRLMNRFAQKLLHTRTSDRPRCSAAVRRLLVGFVLTPAVLATAACDSNPFGSGKTLYSLSIVEVSGNQQTVSAGGAQSAPLVARVVDQDGSPHRGMVVAWTLSTGTGSLSAASSTSDANGQVQVTYTSGEEPGQTVVRASFDPIASGSNASRPVDPVLFTVTVE